MRAVIAAGETTFNDEDRTPQAHATPGEGSVPRNGAVAARETVCPHIRGTVTQHCSLNFTISDKERAAMKIAARWLAPYPQVAATLRNLLERLHT